MIFKFQVEKSSTLKQFLKEKHFSKRLLPKIKYQVLVNGVHRLLAEEVNANDVVQVEVEETNQDFRAIKGDLNIIYEDEYLVIADKPAFLNTIPSINEIGLINYLKFYLSTSIHVITRLDKNTTGLVLIAKNPYIHALFERMLLNNEIIKKYYAIANKAIFNGKIELRIKKDVDSVKRIIDDKGYTACTEYRLIQDFGKTALYEIILHTGRTHQIRVHFSSVQANLLGDELYLGDTSFFKRQALHCGYLEFEHPIIKKIMRIRCELPRDFKEYIKNSQN